MTDTDWANWWCSTWRWMHPGWQAWLSAQQGVDLEAFGAVSRSRPGDLLMCLGITPTQPPPPMTDLVQWLSLSAEQRLQAFLLVQTICFAAHTETQNVTDEQWVWCRGLAKALRPGLWLPNEGGDVRNLLGGWLGEECWSRLRLSWAPDEGLAPAPGLPVRKLDALWRAVLWRVGT